MYDNVIQLTFAAAKFSLIKHYKDSKFKTDEPVPSKMQYMCMFFFFDFKGLKSLVLICIFYIKREIFYNLQEKKMAPDT